MQRTKTLALATIAAVLGLGPQSTSIAGDKNNAPIEALTKEISQLREEIRQMRKLLGHGGAELTERSGIVKFPDGKERKFTAIAGVHKIMLQSPNGVVSYEYHRFPAELVVGNYGIAHHSMNLVPIRSIGRIEIALSKDPPKDAGQFEITFQTVDGRKETFKGLAFDRCVFDVRWADGVSVQRTEMERLKGATLVFDRLPPLKEKW